VEVEEASKLGTSCTGAAATPSSARLATQGGGRVTGSGKSIGESRAWTERERVIIKTLIRGSIKF
jgi:hypothetical protein